MERFTILVFDMTGRNLRSFDMSVLIGFCNLNRFRRYLCKYISKFVCNLIFFPHIAFIFNSYERKYIGGYEKYNHADPGY